MRKIKKITGILLIMSMLCMTISGCGQNTNTTNQQQGSVQEVELPEFTYVPDYVKIDTDEYLGDVHMTQDGFYYVLRNNDYMMPEARELEDISTEEEVIEENSNTYNLCFYDFETGETTKTPIEVDLNEYVSRTIFGPDNTLVLITEMSDYTDEIYTSTYYINKYDLETMEVNKVDITDSIGEEMEYFYVEFAEIDSEGNLYIATGEYGVWVFDSEMNVQTHIELNNYLNSMAMTKDDEIVIAMFSDNGGFVLQKYNKDSKNFEEAQEVNFYTYSQNSIIPGLESDLIIKTDEGLIEYSFADNTTTEIVNWINSDINGDIVQNFVVLEDGRILLLTQDWSSEETSYELVYMTKTKTSELEEKELISLKTLYLDYDLKARVIEFNKNSDKYRVVVETYDTTDYEAAMTKYQTDLATGNASDIIDLGRSDINELAAKGILEDLYPYIDADEEFTREDFFENVLDAYTVDGKLTAVLPSVYLLTMMGKTKFVGEEPGWTPTDIVELTKSLPEDTKLLEYGSKNDVLSMLVSYDLNSYIDWNTGECNFNSESFLKIMEFANEFPTQEEYEAMFEDGTFDYDMMNSEDKIASDKLILIQGYFSTISDYQYTMERFNEPAICVGFPCVEGTGTFLGGSGTTLGINSASNSKEGAWEFVRYFLTEEAGENSWGLPVNKAAFENQIEEAMTVEYFSEEEIEEGWVWVPEDQQRVSEDGRVERPVSSVYFGDEEKYIYAPTQEMVDEFTDIYMNTKDLATYNIELLTIITEEAEGYFSGQKTAEDVANVIQSRLQIYINENK